MNLSSNESVFSIDPTVCKIKVFDGSYEDVSLPYNYETLEMKLIEERCNVGPNFPPTLPHEYFFVRQHMYISRYRSISRHNGINIIHSFLNGWWIIGDGIAHAIVRELFMENRRLLHQWDCSLTSGTYLSPKKIISNIKRHRIMIPPRIILSIGSHDLRNLPFFQTCNNTRELIEFLIRRGAEEIIILPNISSRLIPDWRIRDKYRLFLREVLPYHWSGIVNFAWFLEDILDRANPVYRDKKGNFYSHPNIHAEIAYQLTLFTQSFTPLRQMPCIW